MKKSLAQVACVSICLLVAGCATTDQTEAPSGKQEGIADAPLGTRIKRKSNMAPVVGANRQDIDNMKTQQGAIQQQIVNNGGR